MINALFAQYDYSYDAQLYTDTSNDGSILAAVLFGIILLLVLVVPAVAGLWKVFTKAGKPGWAAIVPFYNWYTWIQVVGRPMSWFWILLGLTVLSWIPLLGIFASIALLIFVIILSLDLAKSFRKDVAMGVLIALLPMIGLPILGFGKSKYHGAAVQASTIDESFLSKPKTTKTAANSDKSDKNEDADQ